MGCAGSRYSELQPNEVARVLDNFAALGYKTPLLRAALEHALVRVASKLEPADCTPTLGGALHMGIGMRSAAARAVLNRCTSTLPLIPSDQHDTLLQLSASVMCSAEDEVLSSISGGPIS